MNTKNLLVPSDTIRFPKDMTNLLSPKETTKIQIAHMRDVYRRDEVEHRLSTLEENSHEGLRSMYKRMLERGAGRFQVKLSGIPDMAHLYEELPNFGDVLDEVKRSVALCQDSKDGLEITPILLLGPPGVGKTHFSQELCKLLGTGFSLIPMSSTTAGWLLSGSSSQWKEAKPGKIFNTLVDGEYANPVITIDEIDKASTGAQYDPLGALYSLLEHDTASSFTDEFAEISIDASQVIWVTTANDEKSIPKPILNRMNVFEITQPTLDQARQIAIRLYRSIRTSHNWGNNFEEEPESELVDYLAEIGPREMRRTLVASFGNARLRDSSKVTTDDIPLKKKKFGMGFIPQ